MSDSTLRHLNFKDIMRPLMSGDEKVRQGAWLDMVDVGLRSKMTDPVIRGSLGAHNSNSVRMAALNAVEKLGLWDAAIEEFVGELLHDDDPDLREHACRAVGMNAKRAGGLLLALAPRLEDGIGWVRRRAVTAISMFGFDGLYLRAAIGRAAERFGPGRPESDGDFTSLARAVMERLDRVPAATEGEERRLAESALMVGRAGAILAGRVLRHCSKPPESTQAAAKQLTRARPRAVVFVCGSTPHSLVAREAFETLSRSGLTCVLAPSENPSEADLRQIRYADVLVDCLGAGSSSPMKKMIGTKGYVIALDCPSGIDAVTGERGGATVTADETFLLLGVRPGVLANPAECGHLVVSV